MSEKEFVLLIKQIREQRFLLQKDVAKQIPVSKSDYSKIENGKKKLNFFLIRRFSELFDLHLNQIKENTVKRYIDMD